MPLLLLLLLLALQLEGATTQSPSPTRSPSPTATRSRSGSGTATRPASPSRSATGSATATVTRTRSFTPTASRTPSRSPTGTATSTPTLSDGASPSRTPSGTPTPSVSPSVTPTASATPSCTATPSRSPSAAPTPSASPSASSSPACPPGQGVGSSGGADCQPCPAGSASARSTACASCAASNPNAYAPAAGASACAWCPPFTYSSSNGTACLPCPEGQWWANSSADYPPGQGVPPSARLGFVACTERVMACSPGRCSPGGALGCAPGTAGYLCSSCAPGFYLSYSGCTQCTQLFYPSVAILGVLFLTACAAVLMFLHYSDPARRKALFTEAGGLLAPSLLQDHFIRLMLLHRLGSIPFPRVFRSTLGVAGPLGFDFSSSGCVVDGAGLAFDFRFLLVVGGMGGLWGLALLADAGVALMAAARALYNGYSRGALMESVRRLQDAPAAAGAEGGAGSSSSGGGGGGGGGGEKRSGAPLQATTSAAALTLLLPLTAQMCWMAITPYTLPNGNTVLYYEQSTLLWAGTHVLVVVASLLLLFYYFVWALSWVFVFLVRFFNREHYEAALGSYSAAKEDRVQAGYVAAVRLFAFLRAATVYLSPRPVAAVIYLLVIAALEAAGAALLFDVVAVTMELKMAQDKRNSAALFVRRRGGRRAAAAALAAGAAASASAPALAPAAATATPYASPSHSRGGAQAAEPPTPGSEGPADAEAGGDADVWGCAGCCGPACGGSGRGAGGGRSAAAARLAGGSSGGGGSNGASNPPACTLRSLRLHGIRGQMALFLAVTLATLCVALRLTLGAGSVGGGEDLAWGIVLSLLNVVIFVALCVPIVVKFGPRFFQLFAASSALPAASSSHPLSAAGGGGGKGAAQGEMVNPLLLASQAAAAAAAAPAATVAAPAAVAPASTASVAAAAAPALQLQQQQQGEELEEEALPQGEYFKVQQDGEVWWEHCASGRTTWELPPSGTEVPQPPLGEWFACLHEGETYYEHVGSGATLWDLPLGARLVPEPASQR